MADPDPRLEQLRNDYVRKVAELEASKVACRELERCQKAAEFRYRVYLNAWASRGDLIAIDTIDRYMRNVKIAGIFAVAAVTGQYFNPALVAWISANCSAAAASPAVAAVLAFAAKVPVSSIAQKLGSGTGELKGSTLLGVLFEKSFNDRMRRVVDELGDLRDVSSWARDLLRDLLVGGKEGEYDVIMKWDRWAVQRLRDNVGGTSNEQYIGKLKILYDAWSEAWSATTPALVQAQKEQYRLESEVTEAKGKLEAASGGTGAPKSR